jgi:hypothetical protein
MPTGFCQRSRQLGCLRLAVSTHPLGKRFCSPAHAVTYACNLYQALYAFQRHHAARHGGHALVLATSSPDCHTSGVSKGGDRRPCLLQHVVRTAQHYRCTFRMLGTRRGVPL